MQIGEKSAVCLVAFGSNLRFGEYADSQAVIRAGLQRLASVLGTALKVSALYRSNPVPPSDQPLYVNGVALFATNLSPQQVLACLLSVEREFGRERSVPNAARTLDLDLIAQGDAILDEPDLTLPHPRMHQRGFVLRPLVDVAPDWRHPETQQAARELLAPLDISDLEVIAPPFSVEPQASLDG